MNNIHMKQLEQTLTSMEVSEMVGKEHGKLLKDIRRYTSQIAQANIGLGNESKIALVDFFRENTYKDANNQSRPCYDITKKGCEFIAHKLTGVKGTAFTAQYINRFHDMEQALKNPQAEIPEKDPFAHWSIVKKIESGKWFNKNNWKLKIICDRFGWTRKFLYHKILVELSDLHNLELVEKFYTVTYGHKPEYKMDLFFCRLCFRSRKILKIIQMFSLFCLSVYLQSHFYIRNSKRVYPRFSDLLQLRHQIFAIFLVI